MANLFKSSLEIDPALIAVNKPVLGSFFDSLERNMSLNRVLMSGWIGGVHATRYGCVRISGNAAVPRLVTEDMQSSAIVAGASFGAFSGVRFVHTANATAQTLWGKVSFNTDEGVVYHADDPTWPDVVFACKNFGAQPTGHTTNNVKIRMGWTDDSNPAAELFANVADTIWAELNITNDGTDSVLTLNTGSTPFIISTHTGLIAQNENKEMAIVFRNQRTPRSVDFFYAGDLLATSTDPSGHGWASGKLYRPAVEMKSFIQTNGNLNLGHIGAMTVHPLTNSMLPSGAEEWP